MAITKETVIGKIEVVGEYRGIQIREDVVIKEDDKELSRSFKRHVIWPNISADDLAKEHADVQKVANSGIWTQAVKDSYTAHLASLK